MLQTDFIQTFALMVECVPAKTGDLLTRCFPNSGRIMAAQFSVFTTFPCTLLIFKLLPTSVAPLADMHSLMLPYGSAFFVTGLLISW